MVIQKLSKELTSLCPHYTDNKLRLAGIYGLFEHAIDQSHGGNGDRFCDLIAHHKDLGKSTLDSSLLLSINSHLWRALFPIYYFGTTQQKSQYLKPLVLAFLLAGEPIVTHILLSLVTSLFNIVFYNLYGPLETNAYCYWKVNATISKQINQVPIGFPACNDRLKLDGSSGELWVEGPSLTSGYWINDLRPHKEWYRTGDLIDRLEDDALVYKGRIDRMLKYKGFRIESCEIENSLLVIPEVEAAVVCLVEENMVAFLVVNDEIDVSPQRLIKALEASLPNYMIPSKILFLMLFLNFLTERRICFVKSTARGSLTVYT